MPLPSLMCLYSLPRTIRPCLFWVGILLCGCGEDTPSPLPDSTAIPGPSDTSRFEPEILASFEERTDAVRAAPTAANWAHLASVYHAHDQLDDAIDCYRTAIEAGNESSRIVHLLALALDETGQREQAVEAMSRATGLEPLSQSSYWRLGQWQLEAGDQEAAEQSMRQALAIGLQNRLMLQAAGKYMIDTGRSEEAVPFLSALIRANPSDRYAHFLLGTAQVQMGNHVDGKAHLELGRHAKPDWTDVHFNSLAVLLRGPRADFLRLLAMADAGHVQQALDGLDRLESRLSDDPVYYVEFCKRLRIAGQPDRARSAIDKALAIDPQHVQANYQLAGLFYDRWKAGRGRPDDQLLLDALAQIDLTVELNPTSAPSHAQRAQILQKMGRVEDSFEAWMQADQLDLQNQRFSFYAAKLILDSGDRPRAIELLKIYCQRFPYDMQVRKMLGLAQWRQGDLAGARASLLLAAKGLPKDLEIRQAINAIDRQ